MEKHLQILYIHKSLVYLGITILWSNQAFKDFVHLYRHHQQILSVGKFELQLAMVFPLVAWGMERFNLYQTYCNYFIKATFLLLYSIPFRNVLVCTVLEVLVEASEESLDGGSYYLEFVKKGRYYQINSRYIAISCCLCVELIK